MSTSPTTNAPETQASPTAIDLTAKAVEQVRTIKKRENLTSHVLRISVVGGGCSGMSYRMGFVEAASEGDRVTQKDDVTVVVDPKSALYLQGTVIDYSDDLNGQGFTFTNPNAKRSCGCGSSFSG